MLVPEQLGLRDCTVITCRQESFFWQRINRALVLLLAAFRPRHWEVMLVCVTTGRGGRENVLNDTGHNSLLPQKGIR